MVAKLAANKANDAGAYRSRRSLIAHPELADPAALRRVLAEHGSLRQAAAAALGVGRRALRDALTRPDAMFVPARYVERRRLAVEAEQAAKARQRRVVEELRARGLTRRQIADVLGIERFTR